MSNAASERGTSARWFMANFSSAAPYSPLAERLDPTYRVVEGELVIARGCSLSGARWLAEAGPNRRVELEVAR